MKENGDYNENNENEENQIILTNSIQDIHAPEVISIKTEVLFDNISNRPYIFVNGEALDDVSGHYGTVVSFYDYPGNIVNWQSDFHSTSYSIGSGGNILSAFGGSIPLNNNFISGEYILKGAFTRDEAGNTRWYTSDELSDLGIKTAFSIYAPTDPNIAQTVTASSGDD